MGVCKEQKLSGTNVTIKVITPLYMLYHVFPALIYFYYIYLLLFYILFAFKLEVLFHCIEDLILIFNKQLL